MCATRCSSYVATHADANIYILVYRRVDAAQIPQESVHLSVFILVHVCVCLSLSLSACEKNAFAKRNALYRIAMRCIETCATVHSLLYFYYI